MNDTLFIFAIIPLSICVVGVVYSLVFGADIMRWYKERRTMQQKNRMPSVPAERIEKPEIPYSIETVSSNREKELVHS